MGLVSFSELNAAIRHAFLGAGMPPDAADACARVHAESTADGVVSHGINRVVSFVEYIRAGHIHPRAAPRLVRQFGALEVWDGARGPGVLNALAATERGMELAAEHGVALIGLRNTNHWMRGGTYGWHAASQGFVLIAWTNTDSNMPPWGGVDARIGNNPFVMAAPRESGPVVLDMAMSQYSWGKLEVTRQKNEVLPFPGGFDTSGNLTGDPAVIEESKRLLPMGMWKGSGFSVLLDVLAAVLSDGLPTNGIDGLEAGNCVGCSQVFILVDPRKVGGADAAHRIADGVVDYVRSSTPDEQGRPPEYPGEGTLRRRERSLREGVQIDDAVWAAVRALGVPGGAR